MLLIEKYKKKEKRNSLDINSENDFKELDIETDKVIRGEASFEEEKNSYEEIKEQNENKENFSKSQENSTNNNLNYLKFLQCLYQIQQEDLKKCQQNSIINSERLEGNQNIQNNNNLKNIIENKNLSNSLNNKNNFGFLNLNNNLFFNNNNNNIRIGDLNQIQNQNYNFCNLDLNNIIDINKNKNIYDYNNTNKNVNNFDINYYNHNIYYDSIKNNINNNINNINNINYINNINNINNINVNNIPLTFINNEFINNNKIQNLQVINGNKNNYSNKNSNLLNNFNNNYLNNININISLLPIERNLQLLNNQIVNGNNKMNNINDQININNILGIKNNINLINNNSQLNLNILNINKINIINQIKKNTLYKINQNNNNNLNKRKNINTKTNLNNNIINLMEIFLLRDKRTTIMIKNIPNKYTISSFLAEINVNFKNTYDIFYLPIDYVNKCNLGFAFINFVEPFHIILFYELYRGKKWKKFNSDKICELLYAKFQGKKELIAHFEKGKVLSMDSEDKRPLILSTPNPLPKIILPGCYFDLFIKIYPNISYEIKEYKNTKDNIGNNNNSSLFPFFSIKGNFYKK